MKQQKLPRGRPPIDLISRLEQRSIRLTAAQWEKIDLNGLVWLRNIIENSNDKSCSGSNDCTAANGK